jgi:predicted nucleic acid-binding Zn ribbon protein
LLLIAKPAASSAALLMRLPVDSCSMLLDKERLLRVKAFWLMSELMLVLMTVMIFALYEMCLKSF